MKNSELGRTLEIPLANSPESLKRCTTPITSPFSKSVLNLLSPIRLQSSPRPYFQTNPSYPTESLNLLSPIAQDKSQPHKCIQKLDFAIISVSTTLKFNSLSAKITIGQEKDASPIPLKQVKRQRKEPDPLNKICCNCQKSRCLKLYCDCFSAGIYCSGCNCKECMNIINCEEMRRDAVAATLDRNPGAFKPKIKTVNSLQGESQAVHNKGCNCSKSGCLKKYCECYQRGIQCTENCHCIGCRNIEKSFKLMNQIAL